MSHRRPDDFRRQVREQLERRAQADAAARRVAGEIDQPAGRVREAADGLERAVVALAVQHHVGVRIRSKR